MEPIGLRRVGPASGCTSEESNGMHARMNWRAPRHLYLYLEGRSKRS